MYGLAHDVWCLTENDITQAHMSHMHLACLKHALLQVGAMAAAVTAGCVVVTAGRCVPRVHSDIGHGRFVRPAGVA